MHSTGAADIIQLAIDTPLTAPVTVDELREFVYSLWGEQTFRERCGSGYESSTSISSAGSFAVVRRPKNGGDTMSGDSTPGAALSDTERDGGFTFVSGPPPMSSSTLTLRPKQAEDTQTTEAVPSHDEDDDNSWDAWDADLESDANDDDEAWGWAEKTVTKKSSVSTIKQGKLRVANPDPPEPEQDWEDAASVETSKVTSPYAEPDEKGKRKVSDAGERPRLKMKTESSATDAQVLDSDDFELV